MQSEMDCAGYTITPSCVIAQPMMLPFLSGGAMCVTLRTESMIALWKAGCGFAESLPHRKGLSPIRIYL